jgi:DNA-binding NarL/FixJ family response regulator
MAWVTSGGTYVIRPRAVRRDALAAGAVAYVEKDGSLDDLVATLRRAAS